MLIPRNSNRRRREHTDRVVGILTIKGADFALALSNRELGSPRRLQRATKRIQGLGQRIGHPSGITGESALQLHLSVLEELESWWKSDYHVFRTTIFSLRQPHRDRVFEYVGHANYLGWHLFLVADPLGNAPVDVEYGVSPR